MSYTTSGGRTLSVKHGGSQEPGSEKRSLAINSCSSGDASGVALWLQI